jgi:hypothetical protein
MGPRGPEGRGHFWSGSIVASRRGRPGEPGAELEARIVSAEGVERAALVTRPADVRASVRAKKLGEVAAEFERDGVWRSHSPPRRTP